MSDRRLTPSNGAVAEAGWEGRVTADRFVAGIWRAVSVPVADLRASPDGARDRQLVFGERFLVLDTVSGWAFGRAARDGYVGYLRADELGPDVAATHIVATRSTHAYAAPDIKTPEQLALPFGARLRVDGSEGRFDRSDGLFLYGAHLRPIDTPFDDPVTIAEQFLGTPYLWGGNSPLGVDCSGLVQAACLACGIPCPGDSDLQEAALGGDVQDGTYRRGDLLFWTGHVALVMDEARLIHANAHHMSVTIERVGAAIDRIAGQGDGPVTAHRRL